MSGKLEGDEGDEGDEGESVMEDGAHRGDEETRGETRGQKKQGREDKNRNFSLLLLSLPTDTLIKLKALMEDEVKSHHTCVDISLA